MIRQRVRFKIGATFLFAAMLIISGCGNGQSKSAKEHLKWDTMPSMSIDLNKSYNAYFTTNKGEFNVKLFASEAPVTVNNFVFLAKEGFYNGLAFNRIVESFMIQGGDPTGSGTGNAGYFIPDELNTEMTYESGIVAMANNGKPNTGGSQFFICTGHESANLNQMPNYAIFGKVESGMDTVLAIAKTPVKDGTPIDQVIIEKIEIKES